MPRLSGRWPVSVGAWESTSQNQCILRYGQGKIGQVLGMHTKLYLLHQGGEEKNPIMAALKLITLIKRTNMARQGGACMWPD